jgi:rod shape-determining protein MreC
VAARPFHSIRANRGAADGISPGFPVITPEGVVGRVLRAGRHHADIQIITDGDFALDVLLQRSRVRGVLHGYAGDRCRLQLHRQAEIRIGDTIITSGIVGSFPKGLPVGRVIGISYETDNVTQVVTVEPWVQFPRLETIAIIERGDRDIERIKSIGGPAWIDDAIGNDSATPRPEGG